MNTHKNVGEIDWKPVLSRIRWVEGQRLPTYPGNLKTALLNHVGLTNDPKGAEIYQIACEIARLTTFSDPEIVYWFSRILSVADCQPNN
ncbi:hypothetical protein NIES4071_04730 [Calothrix sp. NIES-4071]|nr:hypothetical protein NIES4071_04730 [Calothrix sp. NIES-4071]BAZ54819.1 hypothetical protein NIES4105_04720 [Calothrix sp. NIES-4105]